MKRKERVNFELVTNRVCQKESHVQKLSRKPEHDKNKGWEEAHYGWRQAWQVAREEAWKGRTDTMRDHACRFSERMKENFRQGHDLR